MLRSQIPFTGVFFLSKPRFHVLVFPKKKKTQDDEYVNFQIPHFLHYLSILRGKDRQQFATQLACPSDCRFEDTMGSSTAAAGSEAMKLCIFDLRRGQREGQELEKILFFFPADLPFSTQLSVIGLSEGLITFTRIFSPDEACEVIEAEMHRHIFYEAEPDIWMVMVVEKQKESESIWRIDALQRILKEVYSLFLMFHGSVRELLDQEPGGGLARSQLYFFVMDYLGDFLTGKKIQLPNFRDSLRERGSVQMLTIGREAALEVQSLVKLLESCAGSTRCYSVILFRDLLVSTTLSMDDTMNLFTYAVLRLLPHTLSTGASSWPPLRKGNAGTNAAAGSILANSGPMMDQYLGSHNPNYGGDNHHLVRPLQRNKWSKANDGFLFTDIWGTDVGCSHPATPSIWLKQAKERMHLLAYQYKSLTTILLLPVMPILDGAEGLSSIKQQILGNALTKLDKVEEKLSKGWAGENAYHVSGYRYLLVDTGRNISRASPPKKVTTLAKESLLALNILREDVNLEKGRAKWEDPDHEKDLEACIRAKNNAWVIARVIGGKELYMVLEKASETILSASDAVEKFSDRYCNGSFPMD